MSIKITEVCNGDGLMIRKRRFIKKKEKNSSMFSNNKLKQFHETLYCKLHFYTSVFSTDRQYDTFQN